MKKILIASMILIGMMAAILVYERFFVQGMFGPSSMLAMSLLFILFLLLLVTFLSYETRFRQTMAKLWTVGISVFLTYFLVDLAAGFF